ncbi:hypothetical protein PLICRDRAFT_180085 [Plicaturopsis crispa FD-325 SS-3]|uniref:Uncharacterized protein n=1 Tax=Plicaturopsis crispa FD-325 SS-3 TaxID=944288 RepID=A0A0C9T6P6_PLICR|nr:hypothetical protein PLICRDRAFT_180085 [Plicaturopsis crispa FD-325 SS-3]
MVYTLTVYGGYLITPRQVAQFTRLRYPDDPTATQPFRIVDLLSREGYKVEYVAWPRPGENMRFMLIGQVRVTHDRAETPYRCRQHRESEGCRRMMQGLFGPYEERLPFLRGLEFVTVPDPRMDVIGKIKSWRKRRDAQRERSRMLQSSNSPQEDGASELPAQDTNDSDQPSGQDDSENNEQPPDDAHSTPRPSTQTDLPLPP